MYNIDINFLKDRKLDSSGSTTSFKKTTPKTVELPILIGGGVGIAFIAAVGGSLFFLNNQKSSTNNTIAQLDAEIQRLQGQNSEVQKIQTEIDGITQQIG
ncbi:MAG: fimbrial assembly protein, partial [Geminocystis sp. GBBB08]|nr:fimbrial assembly protein [Geminocystis sp. GBBB08]